MRERKRKLRDKRGLGSMLALVSSPDVPELYSAPMSHCIFERIHPFYDGNGRTGRYLLALYLSGPLSTLTALSLSREIAENYKAFQEVEHPMNHGELTPFVLQMLQYVSDAQDRVIGDLSDKSHLLEKSETALSAAEKTTGLSKGKCNLLSFLVQRDLLEGE